MYAPIDDSSELRNGTWPTVAEARAEALKLQTQWRLLGHAFPAISYAMAVNPLPAIDDSEQGGINRNFNMHSLREFPNGQGAAPLWPQERIVGGPFDYDWLHSDFRNVAMPMCIKCMM